MDGIFDWLSSVAQAYPGLRLDLLGRLVLALVLGSVIGWERERAQKPAGLRTNILICLGAALLADLSVTLAATTSGPTDAAGSRHRSSPASASSEPGPSSRAGGA